MPTKPSIPSTLGKKFGRLLILKEIRGKRNGKHRFYVLAKCDCGKITEVLWDHIRKGDSKSCGCWAAECTVKRQTRHGMYKTPTYRTWQCMVARCYNPESNKFPHHGGRGIQVCERWGTFENFLEDMGERPKGLTLDRINNNDGYYKENCRWATMKEQLRNTRRNINFFYMGKTQCLSAWCEELGINYIAACNRIHRKDWSFEKIVNTPSLYK